MESGPAIAITPKPESDPTRIGVEDYLRLVAGGVLGEEDRVELLDGVIVTMSPSGPLHSAALHQAAAALRTAFRARVVERLQAPLVVGASSVPEPDLVVVEGAHLDYAERHPDRALLVVEVSDASLAQDRLSKSRIFAAGGVPEYWIVNLRERVLEVRRDPDAATATYRSVQRLDRDARVRPVAFASEEIAVAEIVPAATGL